ncbi:MAG TPA: 3'-5' exonuclease, partial [Thermoplasmata archaeon]|nr:3'-5' exonuclease [Thermoplasmata archaeon]
RTVELFLLEGSYQAVEDGVVVELFGRTKEGNPLVARYYGFRPYFMITEPTEEVRARLKADKEIIELHDVTTWVDGRDRPALHVTLHRPWLVPQYRDAYRRRGDETSVLACDIPFVHRFLYDKHLGLAVAFEAEDEPPEVRARYAVPDVVRVVTDDGHDIRPAEPFRPALRVLSFDIENAIRERTIFTICGVSVGGARPRRTFRLHGPDERKILEEFVTTVLDDDPDVITGYNIGGYDFPLLLERAAATGLGLLRSAGSTRPPARWGNACGRSPDGRSPTPGGPSDGTSSRSRRRSSSSRGRSSATRSSMSTAARSRGSGRTTPFASWSIASTMRTWRSASCNACGRSRRPPTSPPSLTYPSRRG